VLRARLDRDGYVVVPAALDAAWLARLRRAFEYAPAQTSGTQHIEVTAATPEVESWRALGEHPVLLAAAEHVLARPFHLGGMHGRNPLPGFGQQGLHADWTRAPDNAYVVLTAIWMLDDFTAQNGATRVVPGSHLITSPLPKSLAQPLAHHRDETLVVGRAGTVLILNGYLWHSGRLNASAGPRRAVQLSLMRGAAPPSP
jgi:ectoine hydroxylase-related dioxygenase (phytanoyl-CoA dioxygenase family)